MFDISFKRNNIIILILSACLIFLTGFFLIFEIEEPERVILPFLISCFIASGIYITILATNKDKFVGKIYLISILVHFCFILFWQILKYYILGLHMPTDTNFSSFISDTDGIQYHYIASCLSDHYNLQYLSAKYYGGLFPKIIATLYLLFGKNPFLVTCLNSIVAGLVSVLVYLISKQVLINKELCKIYSLLCVICTSFIVNTSVVMRDVYITIFMYLTIYLSYKVLKTKNVLYLIFTLLSIYGIYLFRPYAAVMVVLGISFTILFKNIYFKITSKGLKVNKVALVLIILSPLIIGGIIYALNYMISNSMLFVSELSPETLIEVRESAYSGSNSDYPWDFNKLYHIFPLLPFIIGYLCLFFAPFPTEWIYLKRLHFVPDMIVLYLLLPSFIKNIKKVFTDKNYFLLVYFFTMLCMFTIYCITVGNSGTIHRLRGPYIPMIYLIAMYRPDKFLSKILNQIQKRRIV